MKKIAFQRYLNWNKSISTFFQALCFSPYRIFAFWVKQKSGFWRGEEVEDVETKLRVMNNHVEHLALNFKNEDTSR